MAQSKKGRAFFLDAVDRRAVESAFFDRFLGLLVEDFERRGEESAGTAGEVGDRFAEFWFDHLDHEIGDGAWCIELASISCALQTFQYGFVYFAESVSVVICIEIDFVDDVDDLS